MSESTQPTSPESNHSKSPDAASPKVARETDCLSDTKPVPPNSLIVPQLLVVNKPIVGS